VHGRVSLIAAGCFTLLICGCGGGGPISPAATSTPVASGAAATTTASDACSFVTQPDAESALGEPVGPAKPRSTATSSGCAYTSLSGSARLDVDITRWPDSATAATKYQEFANIGQPVSGLGDQARGNTGILVVQKGSNLLQISMPVAAKQPDPFGAMKALAVKVLAHL
jgi:hypothetical protein